MKKIIKLTESDLSNIVKRVIKEDETEFLKLRRRGGYPIITSLDLTNIIFGELSSELSDQYGLPEYDSSSGSPIPDFLLPYLDEVKDLVKNVDTLPIWDGVHDAVLDDSDVQDFISRIVSRYEKDN
jgi:hypothetical protein